MKSLTLTTKQKWKLTVICCAVLTVAILAASVIFAVDVLQYNTGVVTSISARDTGSDALELKNAAVPLKAKIVFPSDSGFVLYIGSDTPMSVETVENGELNALGGALRIPIKLENEE